MSGNYFGTAGTNAGDGWEIARRSVLASLRGERKRRMTRIQHIRDSLVRAMRSGEIDPDGPDLYQLSSDLLVSAYPEAPRPNKLDSFSLLVGFACGSAIQRYEDSP